MVVMACRGGPAGALVHERLLDLVLELLGGVV